MLNISDIATTSLSNEANAASGTDETTLGQDEFLELMLTQMRNQDPFKPTDNGEFITQMAQFSQVSSTDAMRESLDQFVQDQSTAQLLNAASLVGRKAMISSNQGVLSEDAPINIEYSVPVPTDAVKATVTDSTGSVVYSLELGPQGTGTHSMSWAGTRSTGGDAPPGEYNIDIQYLDASGQYVGAPISVEVDINSVNLGTNGAGLSMATKDGRGVQVSDVIKFM